jgi:hypothetical protein
MGCENDKIHYHIPYQGSKPKKKWLREYWHKKTGCFEINIKTFNPNHDEYVIDENAALIPHIKDDPAFRSGFQFRRIRPSQKLFPPRRKKMPGYKSPWLLRNKNGQISVGTSSGKVDAGVSSTQLKSGDHQIQSVMTNVDGNQTTRQIQSAKQNVGGRHSSLLLNHGECYEAGGYHKDKGVLEQTNGQAD